MRLGVNIDHVATIRNARGGAHPDPIKAAQIAYKAGADGITAHLREDRRHISEKDIINIKKNIKLPLNLEMAPTLEMLNIALETKPERVCLVPEKRKEVTTEGGLNILGAEANELSVIRKIITDCTSKKINISVFIDPDIKQIDAVRSLGVKIIELHTGPYSNAITKDAELKRIIDSAKYAFKNKMEIHAGHGLNYLNVGNIAGIKYISELNIGHFLVGEAIFIGLYEAVKRIRKVMDIKK